MKHPHAIDWSIVSIEPQEHDERRERRRRRRAFLLGAASMLVLWGGGLMAWGIVGPSTPAQVDGAGAAAPAVAHGEPGLAISGSLTVPLVPGSSGALDLTIRNATSDVLVVSGLTVAIARVDAPNATAALACGVDDFAVQQSGFVLELAAAESSTLTAAGATDSQLPVVSMRDTDVDQAGCVGASLALEYTAIGTRA